MVIIIYLKIFFLFTIIKNKLLYHDALLDKFFFIIKKIKLYSHFTIYFNLFFIKFLNYYYLYKIEKEKT